MKERQPLVTFVGTLLAVILVVSAAIYALPYQLHGAIQESADIVKGAYVRTQFLDEAGRRAKTNEASLALYQPILNNIHAAFFDEKNPLALIEMMEELAKTAEVDLDLDLAGAAARPPEFRLNARGDVGAVLLFLRLLENAPLIVTVRTMALDKLDTPQTGAAVKAREASLVLVVSGLLPK